MVAGANLETVLRNEQEFVFFCFIKSRFVVNGLSLQSSLILFELKFEGNTETSQRWRAVGVTVSDETDPGIEPRPPASIAMCLATELTGRFTQKTKNSCSLFH